MPNAAIKGGYVMTKSRPYVTRGAINPSPRKRNPSVEERLVIGDQPGLELDEKCQGLRRRVMVPRFNRLMFAFDQFAQVSDDNSYRLSPGEKQYILGVLAGKFDELRNAFTHGKRGARYVTLEDIEAAGRKAALTIEGEEY